MSLQEQLNTLRDQVKAINPQAVEATDKNTASLQSTGLINKSKQTGDTVANFTLPDATGVKTSLNEALKKGPVVLTFYRGTWCPYCNLQLIALQKALPIFKSHGATLMAISPESPDNSLSAIEKNKLQYPVLSDHNNSVAKAFGIIYKVPPYLEKIYAGFGVDIKKKNNADQIELPIPATYVIDEEARIVYAYANEDHTYRPDIDEVIEALKATKNSIA